MWRIGGWLLLLALMEKPCSMVFAPKLWGKMPGSESKLFAFERDGRVGFIDPTGKVMGNVRAGNEPEFSGGPAAGCCVSE